MQGDAPGRGRMHSQAARSCKPSARVWRCCGAAQGMFSWKLSNPHKALLDELDSAKRFIDFPWHTWADPEEGGVAKPSRVM